MADAMNEDSAKQWSSDGVKELLEWASVVDHQDHPSVLLELIENLSNALRERLSLEERGGDPLDQR